jgi:CPA1 family monovalent cation:H+ antiporter
MEIFSVFIATTLIRGGLMLKFVTVSRWTNRMHTVPLHWGAVLTLAGSKGALSILMVHLLPATFEYKVLFEHIVIGNILLSILVYAPILLITMRVFKERFEQESLADPSPH